MDDIVKEQMRHQADLDERRRLWEGQKREEAELRERQLKQARMEAWLKARGQSFLAHTGSLPPAHVMEAWQADYVTERAAEEEAERALRLAEAEDVAAGN